MNEIQYTPAERAREIVGNRRADTGLQKKLARFIDDDLPDGPFAINNTETPAVFAEYLARPTADNLDFLESANNLGFEPWTVTYRSDDFNTSNQKKASMVRPKIALSDPGCQEIKPVIVQRPLSSTKIGNLATKYGVDLGDFWEALRAYTLSRKPGLQPTTNKVWDIGNWYKRQAEARGWRSNYESKAAYYYPPLMGLYAVTAALFVDYSQFPTFGYAKPAFSAASDALGIEPVIVRWSPREAYPAVADPQRAIGKFTLDLTEEPGLNARNFDAWAQTRVSEWSKQ